MFQESLEYAHRLKSVYPNIIVKPLSMQDKVQLIDINNKVHQGYAKINEIFPINNTYTGELVSDAQSTKIIILWATIRPSEFKSTHKYWMDMAADSSRIETRVAVNTKEQADELPQYSVIITNDNTPGVCFPCYCLSATTRANENDIIIFASDDFFPPKNWDTFLLNQLQSAKSTLLMVNDGMQPINSEVTTIPIMTYGALKELNHIIYNPNYAHMWSDNELYDVAKRIGLIKDVRSNGVIFEHRHYGKGLRIKDIHDTNVVNKAGIDGDLYISRKSKSVLDLLSISDDIKLKFNNLTYSKQKLSILTSLSPKNIEHQVACINTWNSWGGKIYALNTIDEIKLLKPNFPYITFIEAPRSALNLYTKSYMFINDILSINTWIENDIIAIINSDIAFDSSLFMQNAHSDILDKATDSFVFANRYDVKATEKTIYKLGFDVFIFPAKFIKLIQPNRLAMGVPWWDYYLPMISLLDKFPTLHWINNGITHKHHTTNYSNELHQRVCSDVIDLLNEHIPDSDKIPTNMNSSEFADNVLYNMWTQIPKLIQTVEKSSDTIPPINRGSVIRSIK